MLYCVLLVGAGSCLCWCSGWDWDGSQNRYEKDGEVRNEKLKMVSEFLLFNVDRG